MTRTAFNSLHYSSSQVNLFIDGYHIEEAVAIQYEYSAPKIPEYGYADFNYRVLTEGRKIVQGTLQINYRYYGYLTNVIREYASAQEDLDTRLSLSQRLGYIRNKKQQRVSAALASVIDSPGDADRQARIDALTAAFLENGSTGYNTTPTRSPGVHAADAGIMNIDVIFNGQEDTMGDGIRLVGVALQGSSTIITADAADGGSPVRESYPFIAHSIEPLTN